MKILAAIDFTPRGQGAATVAAQLAQLTRGSVELVHVLPPAATDVLALAADAGLLERQATASAEARVAAEAQALKQAGVLASAWLGQGDVAAMLLARAAEIGADVIVMGGAARGALSRLVLGNGADRLIRRAERPVLVVPEGVTTLASSGGALRVLTALDGRPGAQPVVDFVRALRAQAACDVTFLRLYWPPEEYRRLGLRGPRDFLSVDPEVVVDLQRHLAAQVGALPGQGRFTLDVEAAWGEPGCRILEIAHEREVGLLVLGAESRRGLGLVTHVPVSEHVARQASGLCVLFVPAGQGTPGKVGVPVLMTVLAATDLSPAGDRAIPFAYTLLAGHGGVVELCHVHERPLANPPYAYDVPQGQLSAAERAQLESRLRALIPPEADRLGITTHVTVVDGGKAGVALVQAAERLWADAVVVGSHGRGKAARALLGSVSDEVVRHAGRPVFVVPTSSPAAPRG
ncbi:MAG TPA: universal stress protein [Polyangia bacterium]|nr:universal stress protein [Polyangia bacterium]